MEINLRGIVIIVGNYGSGKTEVAINLAVNRKGAGLDVRVADLDLVNPYFRTREAKGPLAELDIEVVLPPEPFLHADLPILTPAVSGMIRESGDLTLLDVGGDDAGATVLATLADAFEGKQVEMLQVINPRRPATQSIDGCLKIRGEIEKAAQLKITGFIGNANLIDETSVDDIYSGYEFVQTLSEQNSLPLKFITVGRDLLPQIDRQRFDCPVLAIDRQLVPPWKKAVKLSS